MEDVIRCPYINKYQMKTRILFGILIPSIAIILYLLGSSFIKFIPIEFVENERINNLFKFQSYGLMLSFLVLVITLLMAPNSKKYLRFGDLSSRSKTVKLLGIKEKDNWYNISLSFLLIITILTALFMYFSVGKTANWNNLLPMLPFIFLFSLTNSFNEEIITRFSVVGLLEDHLKPIQIMWSSAFIFGLIHYFGNPGGFIGVLMAGFLGWLLTKSIIETKGIGVAWVVHFVQDIVIFGFLLISL